MTRTIVASQLDPAFTQTLERRAAGAVFVAAPRGAPEALPGGAEVLVAAPFHRAGEPHAPRPPRGWPFDLKWVQLVSVGIDFYPDWIFDGPVVTCARGTSAVALAEFALAAILSHAKQLPDVWIRQASDWSPKPLALVSGQVLGLIGFGGIGQALAPRAAALGMSVVAVRRDRSARAPPGVRYADTAAEVFSAADHVVLAAPATAETKRLVNADILAGAKPGLHLVNVARGALVDNDALIAALDDGRLSRATLDVTYPEPLPPGHPLYAHPRVRLSPHTSVHTPDTRENLAALFADNLTRFRSGAALRDVVDPARGY